MLAALRIAMPGLGASLPDAALAGIFLAAWIVPERMGDGILGWCLLIMLLEFVIVHSSAFLGSVIHESGVATGVVSEEKVALQATGHRDYVLHHTGRGHPSKEISSEGGTPVPAVGATSSHGASGISVMA